MPRFVYGFIAPSGENGHVPQLSPHSRCFNGLGYQRRSSIRGMMASGARHPIPPHRIMFKPCCPLDGPTRSTSRRRRWQSAIRDEGVVRHLFACPAVTHLRGQRRPSVIPSCVRPRSRARRSSRRRGRPRRTMRLPRCIFTDASNKVALALVVMLNVVIHSWFARNRDRQVTRVLSRPWNKF